MHLFVFVIGALGLFFGADSEGTAQNEGPCLQRCKRFAYQAYRECLAQGGDQRRCRALAHEIFNQCVEENCQPQEPTCEERCEAHANEVYEECIAN
ncbi:MAG: hypothetical protein D6812_15230, partial [Deltaproteobacteria bacterium]